VRLAERQLILDAGHGGEDGGAVSLTGVPESGINLSVVLKLDQLLGFYGVSPILLRETDISLHDTEADTLRKKKVSDLHNRVAAIEEIQNGVVISIHQNTFPDPAYHGAQVFYRTGEESQALAKAVQDALREGLDPANERTPTQITDSVYLMKHITCPAILVECGFLSNREEEAKLRDGGYQTQLALCITSAWLQSDEIQGSNRETPVL
jgi:N-acetylmuramoyl-L-alanine amidase